MLNFSDSKSMAKALRKGLAERQIDISHSDSLELVARQFGFANWNMLSARIEHSARAPHLPEGWVVSGDSPELYNIGVDPDLAGAVRLQRIEGPAAATADGFATLMQSIAAADFIGKHLRLRAELKSAAAGRGALWMRVDPAKRAGYLRFDNMHSRDKDGPLTGDAGWVERSVVLDVSEGAGSIHYGIMLHGAGSLWARHLVVEEVDPEHVPATARPLPKRPTNLGFGEAA